MALLFGDPALTEGLSMRRVWAMPSADTFSINPIASLLDRWLAGARSIADPFARNSQRGTITNDLNPDTSASFHMNASDFVGILEPESLDAVLFDPPYSPRQITEVYQAVGLKVSMADTQSANLYRTVKDGLDKALRRGGTAICFGWNSMGFGLDRGYSMREILLVPHGGAHNDTIVTVEVKQ